MDDRGHEFGDPVGESGVRDQVVGQESAAQHRQCVVAHPGRTERCLSEPVPGRFADFGGVRAGIEPRRRSHGGDPPGDRQRQQMRNAAVAQRHQGGLRDALQEFDRTVGADLRGPVAKRGVGPAVRQRIEIGVDVEPVRKCDRRQVIGGNARPHGVTNEVLRPRVGDGGATIEDPEVGDQGMRSVE